MMTKVDLTFREQILQGCCLNDCSCYCDDRFCDPITLCLFHAAIEFVDAVDHRVRIITMSWPRALAQAMINFTKIDDKRKGRFEIGKV